MHDLKTILKTLTLLTGNSAARSLTGFIGGVK